MPELAVIQSVLDAALRRAGVDKRITDVYLVIGDLSGVTDDFVLSGWEQVANGSSAQGARLHFRRVPAQLSCMVCRYCFIPDRDEIICPQCGSRGVKVEHGGEFYVEAVEVDDDTALPK